MTSFRKLQTIAGSHSTSLGLLETSRSENPLVVFDRDGNFLETWGEGILPPEAMYREIVPDIAAVVLPGKYIKEAVIASAFDTRLGTRNHSLFYVLTGLFPVSRSADPADLPTLSTSQCSC